MGKVYIKTYGQYVLSGKDFASINNDTMRRIVFSPNGKNSVSVVALRDGTLLLTNDANTSFEITISRGHRIMAVVKCAFDPDGSILKINSNWRLSSRGIENREIHTNPDLVISPHLNIDLDENGIGRVDLKIDDSGFACCAFTKRELLFVRMNGHHAVPKMAEFIAQEIDNAPVNPGLANEIGSMFFRNWVVEHEWGLK